MNIQFLGGAGEVGRLTMLMNDCGSRFLFDYGFIPSKPPQYPMRAPRVDHAFISHAHVDHSGMVPMLAGMHETELHATSPTISTSLLLMEDSIKVGESEGHPPPYSRSDIRRAARMFNPVSFGEAISFRNTEITFHSAGHIPGAAMFEINGHETSLFTGDIHTLDTELVRGAKPVKCDNLFIEGTYAGRNHPPRLKTMMRFIDKIEEVTDRGGIAIVPSFAVGRTQELLLTLMHSHFDVWIDGMGRKINDVYLGETEYLRNPKRYRKSVRYPNYVKNRADRERALRGEVIITTSGMLDGGPVAFYLSRLHDDPRSAVLLTGYQVEGSNGRKLTETGMVELYGANVKIECEVCSFDFSAHAGHSELLNFISGCEPEKVIIMHSDDPQTLANDLIGKFDTVIPKNGEEFEI